MGDAIEARTVAIPGADGDGIEAYLARPTEATAMGGVVVIHHMPGYDAGHKEITRRLATFGCAALCPNLYSREAPGADPDDAAAAARARGGVPDDRLVGDVEGGINYLWSLPASNGKAATIGFCSGGRQSVLAACRLPVDAAVDCYGAFVVGSPPPNFPIPIAPLYDLLPQLSGPLLGLFGHEDAHPSPADVDELDRRLTELGRVHEFHRYDGAGHAFFAVDRPSYRPAAASDGWLRVRDFLARHLAS